MSGEIIINKITEAMIKSAANALKHSYSPYSGYSVGACLCTEDDVLFTGVNVENSSYGLTICAEASAICQMIAGGKSRIKSMVILAGDNALCSPCGACRQIIYEFSTPQTQLYLCDQLTVLKNMSIDDLLPMAFRLSGTKK